VKVYISVDIEGISGVVHADMMMPGEREYDRGRTLMVNDANAAIEGAVQAGADYILVADGHGPMRNIRIEDLHPAAHLVTGTADARDYCQIEGADSEPFDAAIFVGYHAKAGHPTGLFAHTGSGVVADVRVNGVSVGDGGLNTLFATWHGVPVVLVTGDDVAVKQVAEVATGARTVVTKRAINQRAAELRPLADVHRDIETAARTAVAGATRVNPTRVASYRVELQLRSSLIPQVAEILPGMERPAPDTLAFSADTMPRAYALIRFLYRYVNPD
jgi:D-amino peptidase